MEVISALKNRLQQQNCTSVIIPHSSADGDAVGACTAWYELLQKTGIACSIVTPDDFPEYLRWLKGADKVVCQRSNPAECKRLLEEADLIFMLDHNTVSREGELAKVAIGVKAEKVIIDHHPDPDSADYLISDITVSSTCELLYMVAEKIWGKEVIDKDIANSLYMGINTDTGGFSHNSSRPQTFRIVADLLERGLEKEYVHQLIYQNNTLSRLRLLGNSLLNKLTVHSDYPLAIIPITMEELERYDYKEGDLEGVVNIPLSMAHIQVSIQITQRKDKVKLSFRSKGNVAVNEWAKAYFNGGGHLNAAGGQMNNMPIESVIRLVYETATWFFNRICKI